jgi:hypothetical protein
MLQLHATPWLRNSWGKKELFYRIVPHARPAHSLANVIGGPYLTCSYLPAPGQPSHDTNNPQRAGCSTVTSSASAAMSKLYLLRLGILVLELVFGCALEEHPMHRALVKSEQLRDWADRAAATEWRRHVAERRGGNSIRLC